VTAYYAPECERGLKWNDAALGIKWPIDSGKVRLSGKDRTHPALKDMDPAFVFES
jgi:dTDP-4-dehydrorhamnose 3,5-epimerase